VLMVIPPVFTTEANYGLVVDHSEVRALAVFVALRDFASSRGNQSLVCEHRFTQSRKVPQRRAGMMTSDNAFVKGYI